VSQWYVVIGRADGRWRGCGEDVADAIDDAWQHEETAEDVLRSHDRSSWGDFDILEWCSVILVKERRPECNVCLPGDGCPYRDD
jgi:hypothetical protein